MPQHALNSAHFQTAESPVIERMSCRADPVLLFMRLPNEAYVCCGRLELLALDSKVRPLQITWRLLDFAAITQRPDFKDLVTPQ